MAILPGSTLRPAIVCLSTADWDAELWTNKQHLMSRLAARGVHVLYIDSLGLRSPGASRRDLLRVGKRLARWRPWARPADRGVLRDSPLVLPFHRHRLVRKLNLVLLRARLRRNRARWFLGRGVLWTYTPTAVDLYDPKHYRALVYHCVDDLAAYPGVHRESFEEAERALLRRADVCIASSRPLVRLLESRGAKEVLYWPNPADVQRFAAAVRTRRESGPVIGFIGAIQEHKVDMALISECARARPDWEFRLVGPTGLGLASSQIGAAELPPNVRFHQPVSHEALPEVVQEFDVGMIPYVLNDYTANVFPMKVFEYLAAGMPVVSTPLPSLVDEVEHVSFAADAAGFLAAIEDALRESATDPGARNTRMTYTRAFSWDARADEALALLRAL